MSPEETHIANDDDDTRRAEWRTLVGRTLPEAAKQHTDWPVRDDHCFARILLDNAVGQPWREVIYPPAWRNMPLSLLERAICLGNDVLSGDADLWALNNASLRMRGKPPRS